MEMDGYLDGKKIPTPRARMAGDGLAESEIEMCGLSIVSTAEERRLLAKKTVFVFILTYALIPLVMLKSELPKMIYTIFLVLLHVFILVAYFYKVNIRELDPDWKSLCARMTALMFTSYLLYIAARKKKGSKERELVQTCIEMLVICVIHTVVLVLLVVRVRYVETTGAGYTALNNKTHPA
eukprot:jgi/Bigna1/83970/fgenesh1_pg.119_\